MTQIIMERDEPGKSIADIDPTDALTDLENEILECVLVLRNSNLCDFGDTIVI